MHLIALGWMYVVLMMALAEALGPGGSVLGALVTFVLYGVLPLAIVLYVGGARLRARARRNEPAGERSDAPARAGPSLSGASRIVASGVDPGGGGESAGEAVAPVREEP